MLWWNERLQVEKLICYYSNTKDKCWSTINRDLAMDWMKSKEVEPIQHKWLLGMKKTEREGNDCGMMMGHWSKRIQ